MNDPETMALVEELEDVIRADERLKCVKICKSLIENEESEFYWIPDSKYACERIAELIHERGIKWSTKICFINNPMF